MNNYIREHRKKYDHPDPKKPYFSPHKHCKIDYDAKTQYTPNVDDSTKLDDKGIKQVQCIMGNILYYARAVNTKLLVSLREIGSQQATSTESTSKAISQILDYVATYPNNVITY